ncbi:MULTISPECIES: NAD(P)/FAD-dependent oxidoreductase [unclassified Streptomyces]|uniref:NAD(P)/FAD-dependent oxidoreductase n=1 Tax=unclassified Streptomyces TaxID=2593676 RepID=UPI00038108CC|nr:NAD(P)/FAD-dependent oxidoreductase [Streptomyces sp. BoleA5]MYX32405.1 FAD-dependent oxidoreductase [Streptomyces sp. SID8377]
MTGERYELAVVGAGPAGLAAALEAADAGVRVALVDAAPQAGGQFYRQPAPGLRARRAGALHHAWGTWRRLRGRLDAHIGAGRVTHLPGCQVWCLEPGFTLHTLEAGAIGADGVVLATGGYEKVLPFPGWTLPGVVTAGGAQAMLKGGLVLPGRTVVVAGTGPLLLPVAAGLAAAGARVAALAEAADPRDLLRHATAVPLGKAVEGAVYAARLARHGIRVRWRHTVVAAHGVDRVEAVTLAGPGGARRRVACDALAVGHGLLPHTDLAGSFEVDAEQRTPTPGVWAAGEVTGVGGAELALAEGEIAGRSAAARLRGTEPDRAGWATAARRRERLRRFAGVLDAVYRLPGGWAQSTVTDDTVLCRCEEVPAAAVREAVRDLGAGDLRTVKLLTRAGMGWCQGRVCGPGVAAVAGCPFTDPGRPLARPVPLGLLAAGAAEEEEREQP